MPRSESGERRLVSSVERGAWRPVRGAARQMARYRRQASRQLKKDARINIRLSREDLAELRRRAFEEGLPYQTLIASLLHKYVGGRLVDRAGES